MSIFNINLHIFTLLLLLLIFVAKQQISANSIYRGNPYESQSSLFDDDQLNLEPSSDNLFYEPIDNAKSLTIRRLRTYRSNFVQTMPHISVRNGVVRLIPYKKRTTIPLELQKALYAHGIVGRRR
ncbi:unnamed protein product [Adineta steineri]|uniref:Uncharacterized protein n=1 Tax=Adineta steineri TaxID=433720 RepID=A0A816DM41_9BILA|nr:unnamed protein product [Adineta steineri]CAF1634720.1 unnamed protein product [Adineta steineri]